MIGTLIVVTSNGIGVNAVLSVTGLIETLINQTMMAPNAFTSVSLRMLCSRTAVISERCRPLCVPSSISNGLKHTSVSESRRR